MGNFLNSLGGIAKAIAGAGLFLVADAQLILMALVAGLGVGDMPDQIALQEALVGSVYAVFGGFLIWLIPNVPSTKEPEVIVENPESE